jgi:hypothetical protein
MKSRIFRATLLLQAIAVAGVIGVAAPASVALAQGNQAQGGQAQGGQGAKSGSKAAAPKPGSVGGVVVQAPPKPSTIPADKKAALDAAAAKRKAWQKYRNTTAPASAPGSATAGASASARAEDYPGLHNMASH